VTKRTEAFCAFLTSQLDAPLRLLEVGCGRGELALALADRGFDVTAIDPHAPDGSSFQRVALEHFSDARGFDAVIASVSLHHIDDLGGALDKIASFLPPGGVLALEEWAKERLTGATALWYYHQRRALAAVGRQDTLPEDFETWQRRSEATSRTSTRSPRSARSSQAASPSASRSRVRTSTAVGSTMPSSLSSAV
jgi:ubiquinone/menaquinone biosynthesis C-methylase UbiE